MFLLIGGPWSGFSTGEGWEAPFPAKSSPGSEGKVRGNREGLKAHLTVVAARRERAVGGLPAVTGGRLRGFSPPPALQRVLEETVRSRSFTETRGC